MKKFFIIIAILLTTGLVTFKYLLQPKDLGIKRDSSLVAAFKQRNNMSVTPTDIKVELNTDMTSEEITAVFTLWQEKDKNFPLRDVQVKFNNDGTAEATGYLKIGNAINLAKNLGYSESDIEKGKKYIKYVSGDLPFYVAGTGNMINNTISLNPSNFQIGKVTVPEAITTSATALVEDMIKRRINQIGGADIKEASIKSGAFHLQGTIPESIQY
jgi:hypothetical protein